MTPSTVSRDLGPLQYTAERGPDFLLVHYRGRVATLEVADQWLSEIDQLLVDFALSRVLWDSRDADPHPPVVRERIWTWLQEARVLKASSIVVNSEMLQTSANLSAVGGHLRIRSFQSRDAAADWLRKQVR